MVASCRLCNKNLGPKSKYFKCQRCGKQLCIDCLQISSETYAELSKNDMASHMFLCPNDCSIKAAEAIKTEKLVEEAVKKHISAINVQLIKLDTVKAEKTDLLSLEARVAELEKKSSNSSDLETTDAPITNSKSLYQNIARKEYIEMDERKKRQNSVFLRGFGPQTAADSFPAAMNKISQYLIRKDITVSNVQLIKPGLFRCDILNSVDRQSVLEAAKNLKNNSEFEGVFVRRDLTYNQRMELTARRARLNNGRNTPIGPRLNNETDNQDETNDVSNQ